MPPPDERRRRFEELYRTCHDPVLGYVLRRTANGHDAADVLAETFLTAWRRIDDVPPGDQARPWMYGVARRTLANHYRGERRRSALSDRLRGELADACTGASAMRGHGAGGDGPSAPVAESFHELSDDDRELLALVAWEELDTAEIAVVLGCSRNAVRIRLHRARKRFARALERRGAAVTATAIGEPAATAPAPAPVPMRPFAEGEAR